MFGTRRFMDEVPMLGRPVFQSLGEQTPLMAQGGAVVTPTPSGVVSNEKSCTAARVGTVLATLGVGLFALELTGITNLTGVRKFLG